MRIKAMNLGVRWERNMREGGGRSVGGGAWGKVRGRRSVREGAGRYSYAQQVSLESGGRRQKQEPLSVM